MTLRWKIKNSSILLKFSIESKIERANYENELRLTVNNDFGKKLQFPSDFSQNLTSTLQVHCPMRLTCTYNESL